MSGYSREQMIALVEARAQKLEGEILQSPAQGLASVDSATETVTITIIDPAEIMGAYEVTDEYVSKLAEAEFLFQNLIVRRHVVTIISMPGGGKTSFCFGFVAPTLAQKNLLVWYIDADSPASDHRRMKEVADGYQFKFLNPDANAGTTVDGILADLRKIADGDADLENWVLFFDTLKKFCNLMDKRSVKAFYQLCRKLANRGATVVLLAHANKFRDRDGNLVFEGVGDVRADSDELIFFERQKAFDGVDVTTVVDPDRGAKVRGLFQPFSFNISESRVVTLLEKTKEVVDHRATATPKATDEELLEAAKKYLLERGEAVVQRQLVDQVAAVTATGEKRVRQIIARHSEPRDSLTRAGLPLVYSIGIRNAHFYELPKHGEAAK